MNLSNFHIGLNKRSYCLLLLVFGLFATAAVWANPLHHDLQVKLDPAQARISVSDHIQLPADSANSLEFSLRSSLAVTTQDAELETVDESDQGQIRHYRLSRLPKNRKVTLSYQGKMVTDKAQDQFGMPEYVLSQDGVYLDSASAWFPQFKAHPWMSFNLQVEAPPGWEMISQGRRETRNGAFRFAMPHPQNEIYLLGGPFTRYQQMQDDIELVVYLREADAKLAQRYLQATAHYIRFYSYLIGPYPYGKFAVVENRWQTGYGMPSFTLLGSRVIRLPFILHTSLPHEILHNWWGNGVYVDYTDGNWSEGLTAYLSDHLDSEQRGQDAAYRRKALERYANFAAQGRDFPLSQFRSRHSDASQAVGYSKSLMLFHMLRQQAGDVAFKQRIKRLWRTYQFQHASYRDVIRTLFEGEAQAYEAFVAQWLHRTGAPKLSLGKVRVNETASGYRLTMKVNQEQATSPYTLQVPLDVKLAGVEAPARRLININSHRNRITLDFAQRPQAVTLDPDYDVFRLLHPQERPASLGRLFGAGKQLLVLPSQVDPAQKASWQQFAATWSKRYDNIEVTDDRELSRLPADAAVWLLGWQNKLLSTTRSRFKSTQQQLQSMAAIVNDQQLNAAEHAVVLLDPDNSRTPLGFIGAEQPDAIAALARKLPHYSTYGRLAFELPKVNNILKQSLPV
ncbi:MAG: M1 family aminopeptidase, partial [Gammaproteobacteria bacterium]|nr:M1 family aminopeptidase [Gammaproteobacteria bacterium]